ncbi:MAG: aldose 1-epimerase family protein [Bacteroidetes bacterium]|nr:aldose 1-epimerase family protein [Bacteroidota bacterium]
MNTFTLSNSFLQIIIASKGAELQSVVNKQTGLEYMWNADPAFWAKKSPVLFPIVGGLKQNTYFFNNKNYQLNRHGFAREMEFAIAYQSSEKIIFNIQSSEETLKIYPFHFVFSVVYELIDDKLKVNYIVENTGNETMYFSVGAHPAFKLPLIDNTDYTDYFLQFNCIENTGKWPLSKDGLIELQSIPLLNNSNKLSLNKELFYTDALVFKHLSSDEVSILSNKTKHGVSISYKGFPYMGIWSAKNADFICIEPWCGIADSVNTTQQLTEKEGINILASKQKFEASWFGKFF